MQLNHMLLTNKLPQSEIDYLLGFDENIYN